MLDGGVSVIDRITLDASKAFLDIKADEIDAFKEIVNQCHRALHEGTGLGSGYLGWLDWPDRYNDIYNRKELVRIQTKADQIRQKCDAFLVVGIGGSYLGARAAIEMLNHSFYNELPREKRKGPKIYYIGHNLSASYIKQLLDVIAGQDICINVISKSGTTTEPALAFGLLKEFMEQKYGRAEASQRIFATTDEHKGLLLKLAIQEGYETFVIPDDIGGRYSVLTPVGLLPMAVAGIAVDEVIAGASAASRDLRVNDLMENPCYQYAAIRNILYERGFTTEILVNYEPRLFYFGEWFKQLFGESEGKDGRGIFPAAVNFTTDLHSMGQYIQEGRRDLFETVLHVEKSSDEVLIQAVEPDMGFNDLAGKGLSFVNQKAMEGTLAAHAAGGVPNLVINIPELSPYHFGYMVYFFEKACAMSAYLSGVNPFDQPGVEAYKKNMLRLLRE